VTNLTREKDTGVSDYNQLVGDFKNPILQPWAAEVVRKKGELSKAGITFPSPSNSCWPEPVPYLFKHMAMQMVQLPDKVVMLFSEDHEVRRVRLNQPLVWRRSRPLRRRRAGDRHRGCQDRPAACHD
jgi:hypothetical protein